MLNNAFVFHLRAIQYLQLDPVPNAHHQILHSSQLIDVLRTGTKLITETSSNTTNFGPADGATYDPANRTTALTLQCSPVATHYF